jgi:membrane protein YdbS with pleckstrin-like domain
MRHPSPTLTHDSDLTRQWWKFLIAGAALLGAVVVAAGLGVEAWFVGMVVVLLAIVLVAVGLALGVARLVTRRSPSPA